MIISSAALTSLLADPGKEAPLMPVREPSGALWCDLHPTQVLALARAGNVYGVGSRGRIRHCVLMVGRAEAQSVVDRADPDYNCEASQTTRIERRTGRDVPMYLYQHNNERCFAWPRFAQV